MATKKKSRKKTTKKASKKKAASKKTAGKKSTSKKTGAKTNGQGQVQQKKLTEAEQKRIAAAKKAIERSQNYAADGLAAQITETLINEMRALDKPWHQTPESQQSVVIARLSDRVRTAMSRAVKVLSASGHSAVVCNLVSVTFKDGVRGIISIAPGSDMRHQLADHATQDVVLVLSDPSRFLQGLEDIKPDADQPKLI